MFLEQYFVVEGLAFGGLENEKIVAGFDRVENPTKFTVSRESRLLGLSGDKPGLIPMGVFPPDKFLRLVQGEFPTLEALAAVVDSIQHDFNKTFDQRVDFQVHIRPLVIGHGLLRKEQIEE